MAAKVDANDYSRFDKISDVDEAATVDCRNCSKAGAKLKCSICKKATYCHRQCQTSDWTYHRRICKKPEEPKKAAPAKPASTTASSSASTSSTKASSPAKAKPAKTEVVREDEAIENAKGYKNGLPYFHREQSAHEKALIGDIAPKKIDEPEAVATAAPAHDGSAWNTAGTFEQRDFTKWAKDHLEELLTSVEVMQSSMTIRTKPVKDIKGDASVCVIRGKKRFLFDFDFAIEWEAVGTTSKGKLKCHDIGNDGDYEIQVVYDKKPSDPIEAQALHKAVMDKTTGLHHAVVQKFRQFTADFQAL